MSRRFVHSYSCDSPSLSEQCPIKCNLFPNMASSRIPLLGVHTIRDAGFRFDPRRPSAVDHSCLHIVRTDSCSVDGLGADALQPICHFLTMVLAMTGVQARSGRTARITYRCELVMAPIPKQSGQASKRGVYPRQPCTSAGWIDLGDVPALKCTAAQMSSFACHIAI